MVEEKPIHDTADDFLILPLTEPGSYRVEWWDTQRGKAIQRELVATSESGLCLTIPSYTTDLACKAVRSGTGNQR